MVVEMVDRRVVLLAGIAVAGLYHIAEFRVPLDILLLKLGGRQDVGGGEDGFLAQFADPCVREFRLIAGDQFGFTAAFGGADQTPAFKHIRAVDIPGGGDQMLAVFQGEFR